MVIILYLWYIQNGAPKLLLMAQPLNTPVRVCPQELEERCGSTPCGRGWLTPRNTPLPHMFYPAEFCRSTPNDTGVVKEIRLKLWPLASRLSRSLKVIGTDTLDRSATYDFLLTFHSDHGPISYRFRDKRWFQSKIAKFSHPMYFMPPLKGFPWNWVSALGVKKN